MLLFAFRRPRHIEAARAQEVAQKRAGAYMGEAMWHETPSASFEESERKRCGGAADIAKPLRRNPDEHVGWVPTASGSSVPC